MRRLILSQAREDIAEVLGVCPTDPVVVRRLNEAQERLLNRSTDPVGSWLRYRVCTNASNCVVLPREVRHVKAFWICNEPGLVLPEWYENLGYWNGGRGMAGDCGCDNQLIDRGTTCVFSNVVSTTAEPRKIQVVASDSSDNGKFITLRYFDANGNRVYTNIDGVVQEGERLTLSTAGTLTASTVMTGGLYHVVKGVTNYPVRLYSWDVNSAVQVAQMALYAPSETTPIYREMFIPGFTDRDSCCGGVESDDEECDSEPWKSVTLAVRLQHIPVVVDNDPLVIGNLPALKDMVQAMLMRRRHEYDAADRLEASAAGEIDGEISSYLGDGALPVLKMPDRDIWGGAVFNPI